jgi:hypothetical protein
MPLSNLFTQDTMADGGYQWPAANAVSSGNGINADVNVSTGGAGFNVQVTGIIVLLLLVGTLWLAAKWPLP